MTNPPLPSIKAEIKERTPEQVLFQNIHWLRWKDNAHHQIQTTHSQIEVHTLKLPQHMENSGDTHLNIVPETRPTVKTPAKEQPCQQQLKVYAYFFLIQIEKIPTPITPMTERLFPIKRAGVF